MMLTVPFSISNDSYAEDPVNEAGLYFETDTPLSTSEDIGKLFTYDDVEYMIENHVLNSLNIVDDDGIEAGMMKDLSVKAGSTYKVTGDSITNTQSTIYSGKVSGTYTNDGYGDTMSFVGEGALDLYKYLGSDETLAYGLITLDLVFTVQDMCVDTYKYVKLSDGTYTFINKARTQYMMSDISGTIEYVSTYDPDIVKELTVDQYICGSMTMKDTYEFIDDIADVEEYSSVWVGQEYVDMGFDYDYSISFNDKTVPLYDNQIYMYEVFSTMPISYRLDWVDVFESPYEYVVEPELCDLLESSVYYDDFIVACEEFGTIVEGYSAASSKIGNIPSGDDDDKSDNGIVIVVTCAVLAVSAIGAFAFYKFGRKP